ncbi:hypothetical protein BDY21DRAFT_344946 [Lineolata rhizophorae]|uniref:Uncharacterized protein n=1 Tax=Lineolata rhizophorae TaxID=578093 RepID=A0A6A6NZC7_9PEZI|nr:hypothetical protein BDY21DRAFT_344946 [Lineolata rhizophorae]
MRSTYRIGVTSILALLVFYLLRTTYHFGDANRTLHERLRDLQQHIPWHHEDHVTQTPLFIGFSHNWPMLHQTVASFVAMGWPASDIIVVDNTGTFDSNARGLLSPANPAYMNTTNLRQLGVDVLIVPTLLTFSQLQNFFLPTANTRGYGGYYWAHQDVVMLADPE